VREYLVDRNATQAAIRAGYSKRSAYSQGHDLLKHPEVAAAIAEGEAKLAAKTASTVDLLLAEIDALALGRMDDVLDFSGPTVRLKAASEMSEAGRRMLSAMKVRRRETTAEGGEVTVEEVVDFRLWDKLGALKLALMHRGLLVNRHEHVGRVELVMADDTDALKRRAAEGDPS
jgi:phage terminase small subunit